MNVKIRNEYLIGQIYNLDLKTLLKATLKLANRVEGHGLLPMAGAQHKSINTIV